MFGKGLMQSISLARGHCRQTGGEYLCSEKGKMSFAVRTVWPTASGHLFSPAEQRSRHRRSTPRKLVLVKSEKKLFCDSNIAHLFPSYCARLPILWKEHAGGEIRQSAQMDDFMLDATLLSHLLPKLF